MNRETLDRLVTAIYHRGVRDGLKYGPVVTKWDLPPHLIDDMVRDVFGEEHYIQEKPYELEARSPSRRHDDVV